MVIRLVMLIMGGGLTVANSDVDGCWPGCSVLVVFLDVPAATHAFNPLLLNGSSSGSTV